MTIGQSTAQIEVVLGLLIGLIGSAAALASVMWTIYWNMSESWSRLKFHVTTGTSTDEGPFLQNVPFRIWVRVANAGRGKLLLDSIGLTGAATDSDPFNYAVQNEKLRLSEPEIFRALDRPPSMHDVGAGQAIELLPKDSYKSTLPLHTYDLLKIPGAYWNLQVTSRTGKTWKIPAAHVAMGERKLPRIILDCDWIPDSIRLKREYRQKMKAMTERIRRQAETEYLRQQDANS